MTFGPPAVSRDWSAFAFGQDGVFAELRSAVEKGFSKLGLMLFMQLDHGAILRKETGHESPKMIRWIVAKPGVIHTGSGH